MRAVARSAPRNCGNRSGSDGEGGAPRQHGSGARVWKEARGTAAEVRWGASGGITKPQQMAPSGFALGPEGACGRVDMSIKKSKYNSRFQAVLPTAIYVQMDQNQSKAVHADARHNRGEMT